MAAEYFERRGYRSFGYLSFLRADYVVRQRSAFVSALGARGFSCAQLAIDQGALAESSRSRLSLGKWLRELPKPAAIFTWSGGTEILDVCRELSISVPEEIALLSGSDDDLLCEVCDVPISAVRQPAEEVGARAMAFLRDWIVAERRPPRAKWIAPTEIITRRSTDTLAVEDPVVARASRLAREKFATDIGVDDLAVAAGVSRRILERRFHAALAQSPGKYLRTERLQAARVMLKTTSLPIHQVAEACGFRSPEYFVQVFRSAEGASPTAYRGNKRRR
jgi:LacI family transcriptional regulator